MSSTTVPASIQYTVSMLTLPLVRSRSFPATTISLVRSTLTRELLAMCDDGTNQFEIHLAVKPNAHPPKPILKACVASGIKWPRWCLHLGGKPVEFVVARTAVLALSPQRTTSTTLWQAEKPTLPSFATGLLGMKDEECLTPAPMAPVLKGLDAIEEERGISAAPITPMTALPSAIGMVERPVSPFSDNSDSSDDDDNTFSDVGSDDDSITVIMPAPRPTWRARALAKEREEAAARAAAPAPAQAIKCYKYTEGETGVVSGGVKLGLPSIAHNHPSMAGEEDGPVDEIVSVPQPAQVKPAPSAAPVRPRTSPVVRPTPVRATKGSAILTGLILDAKVVSPSASSNANNVKSAFKGKQRTGASDKAGSWRRV